MKSNFLSKAGLFCAILLLSLCGAQRASADHLAAVDLSVKYISGNANGPITYEITLKVYKICEPDYFYYQQNPNGPYIMNLGLPGSDNVNVKSAIGNYNSNVTMAWNNKEDTLDQLCRTYKAVNSCRNLNNFKIYPAFIRRVYTGTITVPTVHSDYKFSWNSGNRNAGVQNLVTPASQGIYVEAMINDSLKYNNSTPVFTADPIPYICGNRAYNYVNAPVDPNLDSLNTFAITPFTFGGTPIAFAPGYSLANPIDAAPPSGYVINATNGTATFNPQTLGKYVLAFRTQDYDKVTGKLLGYASRDVQVSVLSCAGSNDPSIDSIVQAPTGVRLLDPTIGNNIIYVCPGSPITFQVNAHVNNTNGQLQLQPVANSVLPSGLSYNTIYSGTGTDGTTTFSWTPSAADYGDHVIAMEAADTGCANAVPIVPKVYFVFTIRVLGPGLDAGPDLLVCPLGERPVQLGTNGSPTANYTWTNLSGAPAEFLTCNNCPSPLANPTGGPYTYVVTTDEVKRLCKSTDTIVVSPDNSNSVETPQDELIVCRPSYVQLQANATGPAPYANIPCGTVSPISCTKPDTAIIGFGTASPASGQNTPFYSGKAYHKYQFLLKKADILKSGLYSGTLNGLAFFVPGTTIVGTNALQNFTLSLGCTTMEDFQQPVTNNSFNPNVVPVATLATYTLTPNAWNNIGFTTPYNWDTTQNLLVDICMGPMSQNINGNDVVAVVPGVAIQKSDNSINVCGGNAQAVQYYTERPVVRFSYCHTPTLPFDFHWSPGNNLKDSSAQNPIAYIPRSINYSVITVGRNGCRVAGTLHVTVPDHKLNVGPVDTIACVKQIVPLHATGGDAYQWYEVHNGAFSDASGSLTCTDCADPIARPPLTTTYAVVFSNNVGQGAPTNPTYASGCPDTLAVTVYVNPLPEVGIDTRDTTIKYGKTVQLFAHGAQTYTWSPAFALSDPNSPAPLARPVETTKYVVYGKDTNGCVASDSVQVAVDYRDNILVPTAFTPNGDNRNDVFRISSGLGLNKLLEFRVFNRWGQEVFSTTDANTGWDGKWKGEDQEVGSYQYLIRIGYADRMTEVFKGDVTLVR